LRDCSITYGAVQIVVRDGQLVESTDRLAIKWRGIWRRPNSWADLRPLEGKKSCAIEPCVCVVSPHCASALRRLPTRASGRRGDMPRAASPSPSAVPRRLERKHSGARHLHHEPQIARQYEPCNQRCHREQQSKERGEIQEFKCRIDSGTIVHNEAMQARTRLSIVVELTAPLGSDQCWAWRSRASGAGGSPLCEWRHCVSLLTGHARRLPGSTRTAWTTPTGAGEDALLGNE